jgi:hypothetical protein
MDSHIGLAVRIHDYDTSVSTHKHERDDAGKGET